MRGLIFAFASLALTASAWGSALRYAPPPTGLEQYQSDGITTIAQGGSVTGTSVVLKATLGNGSTTGQQRLRVEVKPVADAFTGSISAESEIFADGTLVSVTVSSLAPGDYKWRAWAWCT